MPNTYLRRKYVPAIINASKETATAATHAQNRMRSTSIKNKKTKTKTCFLVSVVDTSARNWNSSLIVNSLKRLCQYSLHNFLCLHNCPSEFRRHQLKEWTSTRHRLDNLRRKWEINWSGAQRGLDGMFFTARGLVSWLFCLLRAEGVHTRIYASGAIFFPDVQTSSLWRCKSKSLASANILSSLALTYK